MKRADIVRAMDNMVYTINDEDIMESWFMVGVANGDIKMDTTNEKIEQMGYTDDKTFEELLTLFLRLMYKAGKDGLFFDGIMSGTREIKWTEGRNFKA